MRRFVAALVLAGSVAAQVAFVEVPPSRSGIAWVHDNMATPDKHLPETVGAGCAFFDFDNDGWMDIYLINSGASGLLKPRKVLRNALYRNNGDGTFTDVTERAGVASGRFGMGVAAADYDSDGWVDLFVTMFGRTQLFRNNGDGTFADIAERAGVLIDGWTTHAVWFDYNNDQKLDLFVSSFVAYNPEENRFCGNPSLNRQHYCIPRVFKPTPSYLFRNNGDGTFTNVSRESGIAAALGKSFGAVATDINNDGWMDLFVANDTVANFLFVNQGDGTFEENGLLMGVAYSEAGEPRSGMGVDAVDFDGDGWQDLFVANIDQEMFSLYRNQKGEEFSDHSAEVRQATRLLSGWGLRFFDYDNDGDPDLFLANGHPDDMIEIFKPTVTHREPLVLMENVGGVFRDVSASSGDVFAKRFSARGLATGDFDNDGDLDVLVSNNGEPPLLMRNGGGNRNAWIGLDLKATKSNPAAVGAVIRWRAGGKTYRRFRNGGGSYLSSHDPREVLGLGAADRVDWIEIRWPGGVTDRLEGLAVRRYYTVVEGSGVGAVFRRAPKRANQPALNAVPAASASLTR
jgi:enediyne biosynthesis protein E4